MNRSNFHNHNQNKWINHWMIAMENTIRGRKSMSLDSKKSFETYSRSIPIDCLHSIQLNRFKFSFFIFFIIQWSNIISNHSMILFWIDIWFDWITHTHNTVSISSRWLMSNNYREWDRNTIENFVKTNRTQF